MTTAPRTEATPVGRQIAENIATMLYRVGIKQQQLANAIGMTPTTLSRRMSGQQEWLFWEVQEIAGYLGVTLDEVTADLPAFDVWRARRDSNPKPSDLYPRLTLIRGEGVKDRLTVDQTAPDLRAVGA